ncbi:MAG: ATPase [Treponema sp.]|nr:ATPase [Treponema sp.]
MEELRSTETLDKEILEDARKKASRILKTADESAAAQVKNWEEKTRTAVAEIRKTFEARTVQTRDEILARGPLDKRRLRSQTSDYFLKQAMDNFLKSLDRAALTGILERELEGRLLSCVNGEILPDEKPEIICSNLDEAEAGAVIRRILAGPGFKGKPFFTKWQITSAKNTAVGFPAVIINAKNLRITASVENAASALLEDKRAELASVLLGEGALND